MKTPGGREAIAFIDIEFGYVYGTFRAVMMPTEIGAVLYEPREETVQYTGEEFSYDIDVERWLKVTDASGRRIGVTTMVENHARGEYRRTFNPRFRIAGDAVLKAQEVAESAYRDLRHFTDDLISRHPIGTLVFFAASMEKKAFQRAGISLTSIEEIDLQRRIRRDLHLKTAPSLETLSRIIEFRCDECSISSTHFRYPLPAGLSPSLGLHRAMGDAVRIFLLFREFSEKPEDLLERSRPLVEICDPRQGR
ncbi:MAG TPA: hypothetical protein VE134_02650, partial [Methanomicrobiales archaeon]|nr:hypothetical protein [Methanomicrobiales archaeon]